MKYKITTTLDYGSTEDKRILKVIYDSFEDVVTRINRDLQSIWNSIIPMPYHLVLEAVDEDTPLGMKLYNAKGELLGTNQQEVADALELLSDKMEAEKNA